LIINSWKYFFKMLKLFSIKTLAWLNCWLNKAFRMKCQTPIFLWSTISHGDNKYFLPSWELLSLKKWKKTPLITLLQRKISFVTWKNAANVVNNEQAWNYSKMMELLWSSSFDTKKKRSQQLSPKANHDQRLWETTNGKENALI
jgi:hypothetical protein